MDWEKLLSQETFIPREVQPSVWKSYPIDNFEKDYREVISGVNFRNLQNKTQVFSKVESGIVRTRLTHSLEVSSVAKQLGIMVADNKRADGRGASFGEKKAEYAHSFSMILACAGLLHDLGNPPFGHFGEASIGDWFRRFLSAPDFRYKGKPVGSLFSEQMKGDLTRFDGNAQTIHLLLKADAGKDSRTDINISMAVLNTLVKYPGASTDADPENADIRLHKFGYYAADEKSYFKIRESAGLSGHSRHPLTYLLEAADDISYLLSDLQDSIAMQIVSVDMVLEALKNEIASMPEEGSEFYELQYMAASSMLKEFLKFMDGAVTREDKLYAAEKWFRHVRNWLIYAAAHSWFENYDAIMSGTYQGELLEDSWHAFVIRLIRKLMKKYVYPSKAVIDQELMGHKLIEGLLDKFIPAVMYYDAEEDEFKPGAVEKRYIWHIPEHLKEDYHRKRTQDEYFNLYLRFLMVVDYISTMTDSEMIEVGGKIG